ncbi:MAG: hypothetical protein M4D85_05820 [Actinomycetota bacterium]|nr:hypothetical protein [Actinomycetota bacterium]
MKFRTVPLLVMMLLASLLPLAAPAQADTGPVALSESGFSRIVLDEARGQLFVSAGRYGDGVVVTDLSGNRIGLIEGLSAATGLTLTPDGGSLWVTLPTVGVLARVDTATRTVVQRITLPTGQCPGDVVVVGSRLVYGHSCNTYAGTGGYGGIGVVDHTTGVSYGNVTSGPFYKPVLAVGPAGQVYAADAGLSSTSLYLYGVTGAAPSLVASRGQVCSNLADLSAKPDGSQVVTACGSPYRHDVYSADKLTGAGSYYTGSYPNAGAWSADGGTYAAGTDSPYSRDVQVYAASMTERVRDVDFGSSNERLVPRGLAVSADGSRVWAVTGGVIRGVTLRVLDVPGVSASSMTVEPDPGAFYVGGSTTVGGTLSSRGAGVPGATLTVRRYGYNAGEEPVSLPSVVTEADGTYSFADTPPAAGHFAYEITWAGDATRAGTQSVNEVVVWATDTGLRLSLQPGTDGSVAGTALLSYQGDDSPGGQTVRLERTVGGMITPLPSVTTNPNGVATFSDTPPAGSATYTASVEANGVHPAASAIATIETVAPVVTTTLTATADPVTVLAGNPVSVAGTLSAGSDAVAGATVTVTRSGCGADTWSGSNSTTPNGAWSVTDPAPPVGTCTYKAVHQGAGGYGPSTASTSATVALRPAELALSVVRGTGSTKKYVTVTGNLAAWRSNRTITLTAQPTGGVEVTLASGPVDSSGTLRATYQPPRGTVTYRVRYAGDEWYASGVAERVQ